MSIEAESIPKLNVSFYKMNHSRVEFPEKIPDFLKVRKPNIENSKEASMPDLPRFSSPKDDLDEMLARFDSEVNRIEQNFDSLKGSLAALSQGMAQSPQKPRVEAAFSGDLDQVFADFDKAVHRALYSAEPSGNQSPPPREEFVALPVRKAPEPLPETELIKIEEFESAPIPESLIESLEEALMPEIESMRTEESDDIGAPEDFSENRKEFADTLENADNFDSIGAEPEASDDIETAKGFISDSGLVTDFSFIEEESAESPAEIIEGQRDIDHLSLLSSEPADISSFLVEEITPLQTPDPEHFAQTYTFEEFHPSEAPPAEAEEIPEFVIGRDFIEDPENALPAEQFEEAILEEDTSSVKIIGGETVQIGEISLVDEDPVWEDAPLEPAEAVYEEIPAFVSETKEGEELSPLAEESSGHLSLISTEEVLEPLEPFIAREPEENTEPSPFSPASEDTSLSLSLEELSLIPTLPAEEAVPEAPEPDLSIDLEAEAVLLAKFAAQAESSLGISSEMLSRLDAAVATSSSSITALSRDELATVMREMDTLLEYLPNHKIEELAHKDFYFLYLRLLDDLGV